MVKVSLTISSLTSFSSTPGISILMVYSLSVAFRSRFGLSMPSFILGSNGRLNLNGVRPKPRNAWSKSRSTSRWNCAIGLLRAWPRSCTDTCCIGTAKFRQCFVGPIHVFGCWINPQIQIFGISRFCMINEGQSTDDQVPNRMLFYHIRRLRSANHDKLPASIVRSARRAE